MMSRTSKDGVSPDGRSYEKDLKTRAPHSRWRRRAVVIFGVVAAVLALGLALGLGLGLGLRRKEGGGGSSPTSSTTSSPIPTATSPPGSVWQAPVNASWQIVLSETLEIDSSSPSVTPDVDVFDIDLFLHQNNTVIESLHKLGKKVICYFSAGSYEPGRPDSWKFQASDLGSELDGWPGEYWLNISDDAVREIMASRIDIASQIGCDAIDPDNVDGYQNDNGLNLTADDSISYMHFLAGEASRRELGIGLKNAGDIISDVLSVVQFSVNEQCVQYSECDTFAAFIGAGKPVFHIEYPSGAPDGVSASSRSDDCSASGTEDFSTVLKTMDLNGWVEYCSGQTAETSGTS